MFPSRARRLLRPGDTIVSTVRTYLRAVLPIEKSGLVGSTGFACLRPQRGLDPRFLGWWAQSDGLIEEVVARSVGVSYPAINPSELGLIRFPMRPASEQRAIADYLDTETARIDALIAKKRRLLALAEGRVRSALEASMRSGSWSPPSLSYLLAHRVSDGPHETPEFLDQGIPFLSVDAFVDDSLSFSGCRFVSPEDHRRYSAKVKPRRGDVLMTKAAAIGRVALVQTDREFNIWSPVAVLRANPELLRPEYLAHVLRSDDLQTQMELAATSNTQQNLAMRDISSLRIPLPPLDEQARLAEVADDRLTLQRALRGRMREQISRLEEHRQALITAAVTGELEVPGVAA